MKKLALVISSVCCLWALPCAGQRGWVNPYTGGVWNNPGSCLLDTMIRNRMNQGMLEKAIGRRAEAIPAAQQVQQAPRVQRLTYRFRENLANAEQLAASLTDSAKDRQDLVGFFQEAMRKYRAGAAQAGRSDDLGYALAFYLACNYGVANACDVPDEFLLALARQMDVALADMPGLRQGSDAQRQTVAETLVMTGMFVAAGYEQSSDKPDARAVFVDLAGTGFRSLTGLDARQVKLGKDGMHTR